MKARFIIPVLIVIFIMISGFTKAETVSDKNPFPFPVGDAASAVNTNIAGNTLYVNGGFGNNGTDIKNNTFQYNVSTDSWLSLANKPTPTWGSAASAVRDRIYMFSGFITNVGTTNITEYYNITLNLWFSVSNTPFLITGGGDCASTYDLNTIFIFRQNELYKYSVTLDTYTEMSNSGSDDSGTFMNCAIVGDFFYVLGGSNLHSNVKQYNILSNTWNINYDTVPYVQYGGLHNIVRNEIIYYGYGFDGTNFFSKMYSYNVLSKTFTRLIDGNHKRDGVACGIIGNHIYVIGGRVNVPAFGLDYVEDFNLTQVSSPVIPNASPIAIVLLLSACALVIIGFKWPIMWFLASIAGVSSAVVLYSDLHSVILSGIIAGAFTLIPLLGLYKILTEPTGDRFG